MSEMKTQRLSNAVTLHTFTDPNFKTIRVSAHFFVPLRQEMAARYAILPSLVSCATESCPDYTALNRRLAQLYGASLNSGVSKMGDFQVLSLWVGGIANRYALEGEDLFQQLVQLLLEVIFHPLKDQDGLFLQEYFQQKQRALLESMDAEYNDKMAYAHRRCEELLFQGQNAALSPYGAREDVLALDRREVTQAWEEVLRVARVELFALGDCKAEGEQFAQAFAQIGSPQSLDLLPVVLPQEVRRWVEEQPLSQSKLSMGFRAESIPREKLLFRLMSSVLGGAPSSKLFQNVREKMSLCYYCSSGMVNTCRALFIESGVETANLEKAEQAILDQLRALQEGALTEEELLSAKLAVGNSLRSTRDSLGALESSCLGQLFGEPFRDPEEMAREIMGYTKEQVVEAANRLRLVSVYTLKGGAVHG